MTINRKSAIGERRALAAFHLEYRKKNTLLCLQIYEAPTMLSLQARHSDRLASGYVLATASSNPDHAGFRAERVSGKVR